ncbi:MAG: C40 family peptidase [Bacilli bacterium]|nr:C40 family peptidase [Bacilli bacterium]
MDRDEDFLEDINSLNSDSTFESNEEDADEMEEKSLEDEEESSQSDSQERALEEEPSEPAPAGDKTYQNLKWTTLKNAIPKNKSFFVGIGLIIGLLVILLFFIVIFYSGTSSGLDYVAPKCTQINVKLGDDFTQNLSIEEYVISHIYSATKDLVDIDPNLYRVLAIAFNTEAQSLGACRRTYIPEVDDIYEFEILDSNSDIYEQILVAIKNVKDNVMVKKNTDDFFSTSVDGFCSYSSVMNAIDVNPFEPSEATSLEYTIPQLNYEFPYDWVEENVSNWNFKNCPCNDPNNASSDCFLEEWNYPDDEEPDLIYVDGGTGSGISIYAAHYLTSHEHKTYEGVLKLFYPNKDWELKTNDPSQAGKKGSSSQNCTGTNVPFNTTPLSRDEFISLVTEFFNTNSHTTYGQYFVDYAGDIYDMGISKKINPELIYIFARKETGFTLVSSDTNHYNYYGMGHCNTCSHGTFYNSFMEGVEDLFNYFVSAGSLEAVVKKYSYLGDYLANPGGPGDGGCYYLKLPDIYGANYSRCNSSYHCASSGGGAGCVKTTEEEKNAYIRWQADKYIKHRQAIFKLGKEVCSSSAGMIGSTEGTVFLNTPISQFLQANGSSLEEFNEKIFKEGCENLGTGQGVSRVAATAVAQLASYGYKFHYVWGGMHVNNPGGYGVLPNWGPYGPDCSGFVSWALYNAGFTWRSLGATDWGNSGTIVELGDSRLGVGDVIVTPGNRGWNHIVIITNVNEAEGYYNVVEAQQTSVGVVFNTVPMTPGKKKGSLMSNYYANAQKSDAFKAMCQQKGYLR